MDLIVNYGFRNEIIKDNLTLNYCFQCSTCSSGCPVAFLTEGKYNPRKIIEEAILGLENLLMKDDMTIFLCSTCQKCVELCPQGIELTEIFNIIKNKLTDRGIFPEGYKLQAQNIIETGLAIPMSSAIQRRRTRMGIPDIQTAELGELSILIKETGIDKKINFQWEKKSEEG